MGLIRTGQIDIGQAAFFPEFPGGQIRPSGRVNSRFDRDTHTKDVGIVQQTARLQSAHLPERDVKLLRFQSQCHSVHNALQHPELCINLPGGPFH